MANTEQTTVDGQNLCEDCDETYVALTEIQIAQVCNLIAEKVSGEQAVNLCCNTGITVVGPDANGIYTIALSQTNGETISGTFTVNSTGGNGTTTVTGDGTTTVVSGTGTPDDPYIVSALGATGADGCCNSDFTISEPDVNGNMTVTILQTNGPPLSIQIPTITGPQGDPGADGANGADGQDGASPTIGANGNWFIGNVDTGVPAAGSAEIPTVGANGNWYINGADTGVPATGPQGDPGTDGANGADGQDGENGTSIQSVVYNPATCQLDITLTDGTTQNVDFDLSTVIPEMPFDGTAQAYILVDADGCGLARMPIEICPCDEEPDTTAPLTVPPPTPADGATDVDPSAAGVTITFDEEMDTATTTANLCLNFGSGGTPVAGTWSSTDNITWSFTPSSPLAANQVYEIEVKAGATDVSGNAVGNPGPSGTFTTSAAADTTPPQKVSTTPADGATDINEFVSPTITFNEPIDLVSAQTNLCIRDSLGNDLTGVTITLVNGSQTANFDIPGGLTSGETYQIVAKAGLSDLAGNTIGAEDICATFTIEAAGFDFSTCVNCYVDTRATSDRITYTEGPVPWDDLKNGVIASYDLVGQGIDGDVTVTIEYIGPNFNTINDTGGGAGTESIYMENYDNSQMGWKMTFSEQQCGFISVGSVYVGGGGHTLSTDGTINASRREENPGDAADLTIAGNGTGSVQADAVGNPGEQALMVVTFENATEFTYLFDDASAGTGVFTGVYIGDCVLRYICENPAGTYTYTDDSTDAGPLGEWTSLDCASL